MAKKLVAGVDAGSTAIKVVLYDGESMNEWICPARWSPRDEARSLLTEAASVSGISLEEIGFIVGTGYGRAGLDCVHKAMTEITCHGKGAAFLSGYLAATVIDIGGQDSKAIRIDNRGRVQDFLMNDKCAAGTGRFLQVMTIALGLDLAEVGNMDLANTEPCKINSMCTVFAESEVIGLLNQGYSREAIIAGLFQAIASRTAAMAARVGVTSPVVFTGGVARNNNVSRFLADAVGKVEFFVPAKAVYAGAIGAALYAWEELDKREAIS